MQNHPHMPLHIFKEKKNKQNRTIHVLSYISHVEATEGRSEKMCIWTGGVFDESAELIFL